MIDNNVSANKSALNLHKWFKGDPVIWSISIMLSLLSILCVYSAAGSLAYRQMHGNTEYYLIKHSALIIASFVVMWITHNIDYRYYTGLSDIVLWISVPLLIITWRYGIKLNEASRWLNIPFINKSFQPSDLAQLALIANLAKMLSKSQKNIDILKKGWYLCCYGV